MNKSAKTGQMIFLVILLGGLAFLVIRMIGLLNPPAQPASKKVAAARPTASAAKSTESKAAAKPRGKSSRSAKNAEDEEPILKEQYLNPNLFRAFGIETTKNPFVQKEEWYADVLTDKLPGYPGLKDSGYFDSFEAFLPDIDLINGEDFDWKSAEIKRTRENSYSISGLSSDGKITTSITLEEDVPVSTGLEWSKRSNVPISDLNDPESAKRFMKRKIIDGDFGMGTDYFEDEDMPGGLPIPGYPGGAVEAQGDSITCSGVSLGGGRAAALLSINGNSKLVTDGSFIPPRYKVLEIKPDGVVLEEIANGSSTWIPLAGK